MSTYANNDIELSRLDLLGRFPIWLLSHKTGIRHFGD